MKVIVTSKIQFDNYMISKDITNDTVESYDKTIFISINNTNEKSYFENKANVLNMFFDDVDEDLELPWLGTDKTISAKAFTTTQANQLIDFLESNKDKQSCIVHCTAGVSRSGAVGTFVNDYFKGDYFEFKKQNPHILPNALVERLLKNTYMERLGWIGNSELEPENKNKLIMNNEFLESLIGMNKEDAIKLCNENNYKVRIIREDSNNYVITCDLRFDRIELELDNGIITNCNIG